MPEASEYDLPKCYPILAYTSECPASYTDCTLQPTYDGEVPKSITSPARHASHALHPPLAVCHLAKTTRGGSPYPKATVTMQSVGAGAQDGPEAGRRHGLCNCDLTASSCPMCIHTCAGSCLVRAHIHEEVGVAGGHLLPADPLHMGVAVPEPEHLLCIQLPPASRQSILKR